MPGRASVRGERRTGEGAEGVGEKRRGGRKERRGEKRRGGEKERWGEKKREEERINCASLSSESSGWCSLRKKQQPGGPQGAAQGNEPCRAPRPLEEWVGKGRAGRQ